VCRLWCKSHLISIISYFVACLPQLGSEPAVYAVVDGGCSDWPIQSWRHFVTFLTLCVCVACVALDGNPAVVTKALYRSHVNIACSFVSITWHNTRMCTTQTSVKVYKKAQLTQRERATAVHVWRPTANKCKIRKKTSILVLKVIQGHCFRCQSKPV